MTRPEPSLLTSETAALLDAIRSPRPPAFAVIHRPQVTGELVAEVLIGVVTTVAALSDIALPGPGAPPRPITALRPGAAPGSGTAVPAPRHDVLVVMPYRQIAERGFDCIDDGAPLYAMTITDQATVRIADLSSRLPDVAIKLSGEHFDTDDATYAEIVRRVLRDEIGEGEGANFVIKRSFVAEISDYTPDTALAFFARLLASESGAYWTFIVHTGDRTFVGASPERHVSLCGGTVVMNPISGTYRYPDSGPTLDGVMDFLSDPKEIDELYMVVDEELKMMARICDDGGRLVGPQLKEMGKLAHTEYLIEGFSTLDPRSILHETMFAPTVTGSPLESACRVIRRHEPAGRGYYSGAVALIGRDEASTPMLDSAILIRTAEISAAGVIRIGVGATLVRHSSPEAEVAETKAKAAGLLAALRTPARFDAGPAARPRLRRFAEHPAARAALAHRNASLADFWRLDHAGRSDPHAALAGRTVLIIDAEDTFTSMIDHQLRAIGLTVDVRSHAEPYDLIGPDLVILGPGPGDPRDVHHPKIAAIRRAAGLLLRQRQPFLAVCLSHQVLCLELGLELVRRGVPNQGVQREVDLFGTLERVGFYNTFAARSQVDEIEVPDIGRVGIGRDARTGEVHALRGQHFASMQFHAESVLTVDGPRIFGGLLEAIVLSTTSTSYIGIP